MYTPDRRTLLQGLAVLAGASLLPKAAYGAGKAAGVGRTRGILIGGLMGLDPGTRSMVHALSLVDLDAPQRRSAIPLSFLAHGFALDPRNRNRAILFEKRGPGAAEVDLASARFLRPLKTMESRAFYGHGTFSKDGSTLYVAENHLPTRLGLVSVWDGRTLESLGEFPTYGQNPHDCKLTDDGRTLAITNGGGNFPDGDAPCVAFIDVKTQALKEKYTFPDPRINAGHVKLRKKGGAMVVVSAPRDGLPTTEHGGVSFGVRGGKLQTMTDPAEITRSLLGETLSISIHEATHRAMVTSPDAAANHVTVWDLKTQKFLKAFQKPKARGVMQTLDGKHFVVCHGPTATVTFISTRTLEEVPSLQIEKSRIAGSHIFLWDGELKAY